MTTVLLTRRQFSIVSAAACVGVPHLASAQDDKIILGQSAPFTGPAAQLGIQFYQGAKLHFDRVNAQGGMRTIELRNLDDGYEPERCAENTRRFINDDNVLALFGYIGTPTSLAALPLAVKARVPFFAPFTGAMSLREPFNRNVFHVRASYNDETALIVKQLTELGLRKIAVFHQNDAYGKAGLDGVTLALAAQNLKPVATATVERNSEDVAAAVQKLLAASPDAVVQVSAYKSCAAFVRAARKAGYGGTFYNVSFVGTQALADELGKDGAGVVITQVVPSPYNGTHQLAREFQDAIKKSNSQVQPNFSSLEGYLAARVLVEGLRHGGGKASRDALVNGLESRGNQPVAGFAVSFSANDHVASRYVATSMLTGDGRVRT